MVRTAWEPECIGSPMFRVAFKIKRYMMELIKWDRLKENNLAVKIQNLKEEMEEIRDMDGQRD